jgi:sn-glycerol 3-phosphate transport system substrate-binding protein
MRYTAILWSGAALALSAAPALAQTEILWWHAMSDELGTKLEEIAQGFNESQSDYVVTPVYRGTYTDTMTGAIAAFRAGEQPHIVQIFEVGTGTMMAAEGAIYPVHQLMEEHGVPFNPDDFLSAVVGYYTTPEGEMLSFPFNSSTPILYYNRDIFSEAGLDPEQPPETWGQLEEFANQIIESGAAPCGFTTAWPSWVQLENFTALHDVALGTLENGFGGFGAELTFNNDLVARHWSNLKEWQDSGVFRWGGPGDGADAPPMFYSGDCAMYMNSSASRAGVLANTDFEVGFGMLPYYEDVEGAPQNSIIGGATLWVLQGHEPEEYEGVAAFFDYLSQPEVQADWHQFSGYLPITHAAYELGQEQGYYEENPGSEIAIEQMTLNEPTENSKGLRFGNFVQVRDVVSEEMEAVMTGAKTAEQALDDAVARGNDLLRQFESTVN